VDLSNLQRDTNPKKSRKRVGRGHGSGHGKTSGRGHKGQKARSGYSRKTGFEGGQMPLHRRLPKRGFTRPGRWPMSVINLDMLEKVFDDGAEVTAEAVYERHLTHRAAGGIKVLGRGELTKKLTVKVQAASEAAKKAIEAAGGSCEIVTLAGKPKGEAETNSAEQTSEAEGA